MGLHGPQEVDDKVWELAKYSACVDGAHCSSDRVFERLNAFASFEPLLGSSPPLVENNVGNGDTSLGLGIQRPLPCDKEGQKD